MGFDLLPEQEIGIGVAISPERRQVNRSDQGAVARPVEQHSMRQPLTGWIHLLVIVSSTAAGQTQDRGEDKSLRVVRTET